MTATILSALQGMHEATSTDMTEPKPMTRQQQKALHLYFTFVANEMQKAGMDVRAILKHFDSIDIPVNQKHVKEIWRTAQRAHLGKESTTELETKEVDEVWELMNRYLAMMGIHVPFPSLESLYNKNRKDLGL